MIVLALIAELRVAHKSIVLESQSDEKINMSGQQLANYTHELLTKAKDG